MLLMPTSNFCYLMFFKYLSIKNACVILYINYNTKYIYQSYPAKKKENYSKLSNLT